MGFKLGVNESFLDFRCFRDYLNIIALSADDLIICVIMNACDDVKRHLCSKYKMKVLGIIHRVLGCEVLNKGVADAYSNDQAKYVRHMCVKFLPQRRMAMKPPTSDVNLCNDMYLKSDSEIALMKDVPYEAASGSL